MPVYRPKMAYKTTNVRYFDEAYQDSAAWEKYQPYHEAPNVQFWINIEGAGGID